MININIKEVILIHDRIIKKYRGLEGIKDYGALESSLNNAFSTFFGEDLYKTDIEKIANIFYLVCSNHSFVDANKRTAVSIFNILIKINDLNINYKLIELQELALKSVIHEISMDDLVEWMKEHLV
jgi:death-on-curing protein